MTILVIGKTGQLANELSTVSANKYPLLGAKEINVFNEDELSQQLLSYSPSILINAAAYTAVDKAESESDKAYALNADAVKNLSTFCKSNDCFLVHVSTDYVFDGSSGMPYPTDAEIAPQSIYGNSKAKGEQFLRDILGENATIIRTSWVYSEYGNNFVKTMLKLMRERSSIKVVDDQIGSPTWARGLAKACIEAATHQYRGTFHWTDEGVLSWYDFAVAIHQLGLEKGLLNRQMEIIPIPSRDYPVPTPRPHYSVLDKTETRSRFSTPMTHWYTQLSKMMDDLVRSDRTE
ncbi:MAG: dTDP-4-dehydrorhamnose reductase [Pseudomonadota bacterium]